MIEVNNVSMRFNMAKEKHESLKEYFLAAVQGKLQFEEFYALRDVSLTVHKGEFHGIIGLNGSGKSTLLKVISGVFKPTAGNVVVHGSIAPLIELGAGFDMDLTARENIYLNGTVLDGTGLTWSMVWICGLCAVIALAVGLFVFRRQQDKFVLHI